MPADTQQKCFLNKNEMNEISKSMSPDTSTLLSFKGNSDPRPSVSWTFVLFLQHRDLFLKLLYASGVQQGVTEPHNSKYHEQC